MLPDPLPETQIITPSIPINNQKVFLGVELEAAYHPSYRALLPYSMSKLEKIGTDILVTTPTWTYTQINPPVLQPIAGKDATWFDLIEMLQLSSDIGFQNVVFPVPKYDIPAETWWSNSTRDFSWWLVWFDHYQKFLLHHADLAQQKGAEILVVGGEWVNPSLPSGVLPDGSPSGVPADSENRWREILANLRLHYSGKLYWTLTTDQLNDPPPFLDAVDGFYILWQTSLSDNPDATPEELNSSAAAILDSMIKPLVDQYNKPIVIGLRSHDYR
jgi:hypothetical protein